MKKLILMNLAFGLLAGPAFAVPCNYRGTEGVFTAKVNAQLRSDILALKAKGIAVIDSSVKLTVSPGNIGPSSMDMNLEGSFRSQSGAAFTLFFTDLNGHGGLMYPLINTYYSDLRADGFDAEGQPIHGRCFMVGNIVADVTNNATNIKVAEIKLLPELQVK